MFNNQNQGNFTYYQGNNLFTNQNQGQGKSSYIQGQILSIKEIRIKVAIYLTKGKVAIFLVIKIHRAKVTICLIIKRVIFSAIKVTRGPTFSAIKKLAKTICLPKATIKEETIFSIRIRALSKVITFSTIKATTFLAIKVYNFVIKVKGNQIICLIKIKVISQQVILCYELGSGNIFNQNQSQNPLFNQGNIQQNLLNQGRYPNSVHEL